MIAVPLFERLLAASRRLGIETAAGRFGADMQVSLCNDGPVTFILHARAESENRLA